ncbi:MarR family transcriptional regulator [Actinoplanes sp. NPDC026619]|uniref:MarR family transcriptional regulator n=1 Tax=Actinoplanes sp. NPDC026619 TaxID=3155798 RepID=UPI0033EF0C14
MRLGPPSGMDPEQAALIDRIIGRRGPLNGPFSVLMHSPQLCDRAELLSSFCLYESSLPPRLRELALLVTARHHGAAHSWLAHVGKAAEAGVDAGALRRLAGGLPPDFPAADEASLYLFATELLTRHTVTDETYAAARALFGEQGLVELVAALGTFAMLAMVLNAFEVDLLPGAEPPFSVPDADPPKQLAHLLPALWRGVYDATKGSEEMPAMESQVQILRKLVSGGELSPARLAEELRLARPTVSNSLRALVTDGLVERERSAADGRSVVLRATEHGKDVLYTFRQGRADVLAEVLGELSADDQERLVAALPSLDRLLDRLEARADAEWNSRRGPVAVPRHGHQPDQRRSGQRDGVQFGVAGSAGEVR